MNSVEKDSRFSKVYSDPRFLPMPNVKKKVKIDKRFNALFSSKDFGHRAIRDKRGRPSNVLSKNNKKIMERFYDLSSDESDKSSDSDSEEDEKDQSENGIQLHQGSDSEIVELKGNKPKNVDKKKKIVKGAVTPNKSVNATKSTKVLKRPNTDSEGEEDSLFSKPVAKKARNATESSAPKKKSTDKTQKQLTGSKKTTGKLKISDQEDGSGVEKKKTKKQDAESSDEGDSSEEDDDDDDDDSDSSESSEEEGVQEYTADHELMDTVLEHKWNEMHAEATTVTESTHRLAVCNMDWDFVKAQDLYVLFKSFAGEGGAVHSVTIYPSEFGKERMAEEALLGPREMRESLKDKKDKKKKKKKVAELKKGGKTDDDGGGKELEALRNYQFNRLRYYYAVVDCSSVEAADNIYKECDDQEYQLSGVKLDLRFIPDDMTFDDTPKESFTEKQGLVDYTPKRFNSTALSQAKVEVTWDETEFDRLQKQMQHVLPKELVQIVEENRHADIIAPPESDSDSDEDERPQWLKSVLLKEEEQEEDVSEERKIELYRKVLMDKLVEEEEKEKKENEVDKEISWKPGLKSAIESKLKKNEKKQGTVVDDYLEKKREKKKKKREAKKAEQTGEDGTDDDGNKLEDEEVPDFIDDKLKEMMESEGYDVGGLKDKKKKTKTEKKKKKSLMDNKDLDSEQEREAAELELLLMGDGDEKSLAKPEKVKDEGKLSRRQKKKAALKARDKLKNKQEDFDVDADDPRFSAMFTSHHFHIDPSAPEFKKTQNMMKLVDEQIKRKPKLKKEAGSKREHEDEKTEEDTRSVSRKLVESLKKKMKKK